MAGKTWQPKHKAAGLMASSQESEKEESRYLTTGCLLYIQFRMPIHERGPPTAGMDHLISTQSRKSFTDIPRNFVVVVNSIP